MYLNTLRPAPGSKKKSKRLGRGTGSGKGKTCARGHKGQRARAGGYHKVGFEGGQMPLQRRIPKSGFRSRRGLWREEVYLSALEKIGDKEIDLSTLFSSGTIKANTKYVKIIASGKLSRPIIVRGLPLTAGARRAIEAAHGKIED